MNETSHLQDCKDLARLQVRKHLKERADKERFDRKIKALPLQPPPKRTDIETIYRILVSTELGITIR